MLPTAGELYADAQTEAYYLQKRRFQRVAALGCGVAGEGAPLRLAARREEIATERHRVGDRDRAARPFALIECGARMDPALLASKQATHPRTMVGTAVRGCSNGSRRSGSAVRHLDLCVQSHDVSCALLARRCRASSRSSQARPWAI